MGGLKIMRPSDSVNSSQKLHVEPQENLPLRLPRPVIGNRELQYDKYVVDSPAPLDYLPDTRPQRHTVTVIFEVIGRYGR